MSESLIGTSSRTDAACWPGRGTPIAHGRLRPRRRTVSERRDVSCGRGPRTLQSPRFVGSLCTSRIVQRRSRTMLLGSPYTATAGWEQGRGSQALEL
ncbi:hypothetical protein NDU88_005276 [Pleurodeles waltl]|uniref:Uncharacterized protein n=1 Tax=Pleurodeles waltl TaxID=8319 RepID=A0AAV7MCD2_PLEWA|nr:hypothetical protein NDU88_005276 [Pleurodeles waltl]